VILFSGKAIYDFPGEADGDLPFSVGDTIDVIEQIDESWLKGCVHGKPGEGIFPSSFINPFSKQQSSDEVVGEEVPVAEEEEQIQQQDDFSGGGGDGGNVAAIKIAIAIYDFPGETEEDLPFNVNDQIEVTEEIDENWCTGRVHNREGIFPRSFVRFD